MQDNYQLQARQARRYFLSYDQQVLIRRHRLRADDDYLYLTFFSQSYRICRTDGMPEALENGCWLQADSHGEIMTLLDLLCDSREDRHPSGELRTMQQFGHQFHQSLGEDPRNPAALLFQQHPDRLKTACEALGGVPFSGGDIAYTIPVFEDLSVVLQFWLGDEEFSPRLRYLWDANALQYLKYETMYYAVDVLLSKLRPYF